MHLKIDPTLYADLVVDVGNREPYPPAVQKRGGASVHSRIAIATAWERGKGTKSGETIKETDGQANELLPRQKRMPERERERDQFDVAFEMKISFLFGETHDEAGAAIVLSASTPLSSPSTTAS